MEQEYSEQQNHSVQQSLTLEQIRDGKRELEEHIRQHVLDFESFYGVRIDGIKFFKTTHHTMTGMPVVLTTCQLKLEYI